MLYVHNFNMINPQGAKHFKFVLLAKQITVIGNEISLISVQN